MRPAGMSIAIRALRFTFRISLLDRMSIVTKTGDSGTTGLMYNRRVSKSHPRVEACGTLDELNSALGMARAHSPPEYVGSRILKIQKDLVTIMGELATLPEDFARYTKDGFQLIE